MVTNPDANSPIPDWLHRTVETGDKVYFCNVRGVNATRWTATNPLNYVERSLLLLGQTVDTGRVWDVVAITRFLDEHHGGKSPIHVLGDGRFGVIGAYAALLEPKIMGVTLNKPLVTHMSSAAPQFLNVLRICDIPDVLGMCAPRPLTIYAIKGKPVEKIREIYRVAGALSRLVIP